MKKQLLKIILIFLFPVLIMAESKEIKLVILHTNDTHSQIEPIKDTNKGGYARRLGVINKIRAEEPNVLLLDAGDFFQGTPYFNFFKGRVEAEGMNRMGYDAGILGNHEFDNGIDSLATIIDLIKHPIINANYDFENTPLKGKVKPYIILKKAGLKIGLFGLGVKPEGLIEKKNYKEMKYNNPVTVADSVSNYLKEKQKCDLIICISHLGANVIGDLPSDYDVAENSTNIDVIISGHSHELIENQTVKNKNGKSVVIAQMKKSGIYLGRIDLTFAKKEE